MLIFGFLLYLLLCTVTVISVMLKSVSHLHTEIYL